MLNLSVLLFYTATMARHGTFLGLQLIRSFVIHLAFVALHPPELLRYGELAILIKNISSL